MAHNPILRGTIINGKTVFEGLHGKRYLAMKQHLEGKRFEMVLQKERKKRSNQENSYYWAVVVDMIGKESGFDTDEEDQQKMVHDALRLRFLRVGAPDDPMATVRSTTSLTTVEFERYMEQCRQFAAEFLGLYVPLPNETEISEPMGVCA